MLHPARATLLSLGLTLALPAAAAAAGAALVADVDPSLVDDSFSGGGPSAPLVPVAGGRVVFPSHLSGSGVEPWASDGTSLGTEILRDLCPGSCPSEPAFLGAVQGRALFFAATDEDASFGQTELWASDGTRQGTVRLAASAGGGPGRCSGDPLIVAATERAVFFTASTLDEGCEPWVSDGTAAGTRLLRDISPTAHSFASGFTAAGNRVFFGAQDDQGLGFWTSNGTPAGTVLVRRFAGGQRLLTPSGSRVFFVANESFEADEELWVSDGTAAGTRRLTSFAAPQPFAATTFLKVLDGALYFVADDVTGGQDLWVSDGTPAGTRRVTDFGFASPFGFDFELALDPEQLARVGGRLLFPATDGLTPRRLWTSGGTPATTSPLEGCGDAGACPELGELAFVRVRNRVVFAGTGGGRGTELWTSDGTAAGTRLLRDLCRGACSSSPRHFFTAPGGRVFFVAAGVSGSLDLWRTDGTGPSTVRLASPGFDPFSSFSSPFLAAAVGRSRILFLAVSQFGGPSELWASDGTAAGTGLVTVLAERGDGSSPQDLVAAADGVRFVACDGEESSLYDSGGTPATTAPVAATSLPCPESRPPRRLTAAGGLTFYLQEKESFDGFRLWRTDGTDAGTFALSPQEIRAGLDLAPFGGGVAFLAFADPDDDGIGLLSLWASDGTVAGTRRLAELPPDFTFGDSGSFLSAVGSEIWFTGNVGDSTSHEQLWASDGTPAGTRQVTDFDFNFFEQPPRPTRLGGAVYFLARSDFGPEELWRTDGTPASAAPVLPPGFDVEGKNAADLFAFGGALYFFGNTGQGGRGLFKSDGTAAGTVLLAPVGLPHPSFRSRPSAFAALGDRLLFLADDGVHGVELWATDGTSAGTRLVRDVLPGAASAFPSDGFGTPPLVAVGGRVFFAAGDGVHGVELWQTDGTAGGTRLVQDVAPGALSSNPGWLTAAGDNLFFTADDGLTGQEPWVLPLAGTAPACVPSDTALCLGNGRFRVEAAWQDFAGGAGRGHAVALTGDTGYFWFFDSANVEVVLKVLDGRGLNGHRWVFYGALSTVEYHLTVTDLETGAARRYVNPPGRLASVADTAAFGPQGATGSGLTFGPAGVAAAPLVAAVRGARQGTCAPSATRLCLQGGRFAVEASWRDFQGNQGAGRAVPLAGGDTGYFWFFDDDNVEVVLKVLDGRPLNGKFWVFFGALSSVEYTLTVTDTETGQKKEYKNPSGRLASFADTGAF